MKCKRFLAAFLSLSMLVSSWSLCVMAADDEEQPDQAVGLNESDPVNTTLGELQEGVIFRQGGLNGEQTISFTPQSTAKYSFLMNARDISVTVKDKFGTQVVPFKTEKSGSGNIFELKLDADMTYIFTVNAATYDQYSSVYEEIPFTLFICKSIDRLNTGDFDVLVRRSYGSKIFPFTPEESGVYVFSTEAESFFSTTASSNVDIKVGDQEVRTVYYSSDVKAAYLEAGVSYDIGISSARGSYDCFNLVHLNISNDIPSLSMNLNNITFSSGSKSNWYSFTPSENGVYLFTSQGGYDSSMYIYAPNGVYDSAYQYGESITMRMPMQGGVTYYIKLDIPSDSPDTVTFPVRIDGLSFYKTGDHTIPAGPYETVYCPFQAETSGYYVIYSDAGNMTVMSYLESDYVPAYTHAYYVKADQAMLMYRANDDTDNITVNIQPVSKILEPGENTLGKFGDNHAYATFTPETTGMYHFSITCESGYDNAILFSKNGNSLDKKSRTDDKNFTYYLKAGEQYVLDVTLYSNAPEQVSVSIASADTPSVRAGENPIAKTAPDRIFKFVPEESGLYQFYNYANVDMTLGSADGYQYNRELMESDRDKGLKYKAYEMTAGREYTVEMRVDDSSEDMFTLYIEKAPGLHERETSITKIGEKEYATFTPSKTRIYGIKCTDGYVNYMRYLSTTDSSYYSDVPTYYSNGKRSAILEKDVTYVLQIESNRTSEDLVLSIEPERELVTGTNENVLIENLHGYGSYYTCYSFTPEKSGVYNFRSENNGGLSASAILYEGVNGEKEIGRGAGSYLDGNMTMTATLEAGVTYRLWMYTNQSEQDVTIDLIIEQLPAGQLEGYSLSLDGTIAVNLYMSLADYVVKSDTAVLKYTRPDGTVVDYKMVEASVKTVNNIDYYVFHLPIAAKEMTAPLSARIVDEENGIESEQFVFTVLDYAETILREAYDSYGNVANQAYADAVPLVKALLNYGARAQIYFGYRSENVHLANANSLYMSEEDCKLGSLSAGSLPEYKESAATEQMPDGLTFEGSSLSLESENALTFYFKDASGKQLTFTTESGVEIESRISGGYTLVKVTGIPAHKLDKNVRLNVRVSGDDRTYFAVYSPFNYCYNVLSRDTTATRTKELKDLIKALYFYHQAARNYIGED